MPFQYTAVVEGQRQALAVAAGLEMNLQQQESLSRSGMLSREQLDALARLGEW